MRLFPEPSRMHACGGSAGVFVCPDRRAKIHRFNLKIVGVLSRSSLRFLFPRPLSVPFTEVYARVQRGFPRDQDAILLGRHLVRLEGKSWIFDPGQLA